MNIYQQIKTALSPLNIPIFYNYRGDCKDYPLIVFHVIENILDSYDGFEDLDIEYIIYINIYSNLQDSIRLTREIKRLMLNSGFRYKNNYSAETYDKDLNINLKNLTFSKIDNEIYREE